MASASDIESSSSRDQEVPAEEAFVPGTVLLEHGEFRETIFSNSLSRTDRLIFVNTNLDRSW
jgi:hypothetical protein